MRECVVKVCVYRVRTKHIESSTSQNPPRQHFDPHNVGKRYSQQGVGERREGKRVLFDCTSYRPVCSQEKSRDTPDQDEHIEHIEHIERIKHVWDTCYELPSSHCSILGEALANKHLCISGTVQRLPTSTQGK